MGFFKKFKKKESNERGLILESNLEFDRSDFRNLLSITLAQSLIVQERVSDNIVKNQDWMVDFTDGTIAFGNKKYPVQFLGTESYISNTFLWGWENINNYPENVLEAVHRLKEIGNNYKVEVLTDASFDFNDLYNGFNMAIVGAGLLKDNYALYKCPYDSGAAFLLFKNVDKDIFSTVDSMKFINVINQCIGSYDVDHKLLVESLALWNKNEYSWNNDIMSVQIDKNIVNLDFETVENTYRIKSLKTEI